MKFFHCTPSFLGKKVTLQPRRVVDYLPNWEGEMERVEEFAVCLSDSTEGWKVTPKCNGSTVYIYCVEIAEEEVRYINAWPITTNPHGPKIREYRVYKPIEGYFYRRLK